MSVLVIAANNLRRLVRERLLHGALVAVVAPQGPVAMDHQGLATGGELPDFGNGLRDRLAADDETRRVWGGDSSGKLR